MSNQSSSNKNSPFGEVVIEFILEMLVTIATSVISALIFTAWYLLRDVLFRGAKALWHFAVKPRQKRNKVKSSSVQELPTPDIFKGAPNLARAKELKLESIR